MSRKPYIAPVLLDLDDGDDHEQTIGRSQSTDGPTPIGTNSVTNAFDLDG